MGHSNSQPGSTCTISGTRWGGGGDFSVTTKPCSNKQPGNSRTSRLLLKHQQETQSRHLYCQNKMRHGGGVGGWRFGASLDGVGAQTGRTFVHLKQHS